MPKKQVSLITTGIPFVTLVLGGWLGLSYFVKGKFDVQARYLAASTLAAHTTRFLTPLTPLQDAQRKELDLRAPVEKQRAKRFNLEEELQRLRAAAQANYENKPIPRPREFNP